MILITKTQKNVLWIIEDNRTTALLKQYLIKCDVIHRKIPVHRDNLLNINSMKRFTETECRNFFSVMTTDFKKTESWL